MQRQPFGGWKASTVGPGAKAGGPHYVAQIGDWQDAADVPAGRRRAGSPGRRPTTPACGPTSSRVEHDPSGLRVEANVLRYRPVPQLTVRTGADARAREVDRVLPRRTDAPGSA